MKLKITLLSLVTTILFTQCTVQNPSNDLSKVVVLKNTSGWKIDTIDQGLVHYEFPSQYMDEFKSYQNVNVMAIHPQLAKQYLIDFTDITPRDTLSAIGHRNNAIFAINGTYYEKKANSGRSTSYFKTNDQLIDSVQVQPGSLFYWKHEGAFYMKGQESGIVRGNNKIYQSLDAENVMSGSPLLIENYHASGLHFVRDYVEDLNTLNYENPDRHQGVRHPRTAVAITQDGTILFVAVDGRDKRASGMSAKELTQFLIKYFNPKDALNLDGGGSTTFWLKDAKRSSTGVINYPTDNKKFDHYGQRAIRNAFMIIKK